MCTIDRKSPAGQFAMDERRSSWALSATSFISGFCGAGLGQCLWTSRLHITVVPVYIDSSILYGFLVTISEEVVGVTDSFRL